jgi:hypothetical protein
MVSKLLTVFGLVMLLLKCAMGSLNLAAQERPSC